MPEVEPADQMPTTVDSHAAIDALTIGNYGSPETTEQTPQPPSHYSGDPSKCPYLQSMGSAGIELSEILEVAKQDPERGPTIRELMAARKQLATPQVTIKKPAAVEVAPKIEAEPVTNTANTSQPAAPEKSAFAESRQHQSAEEIPKIPNAASKQPIAAVPEVSRKQTTVKAVSLPTAPKILEQPPKSQPMVVGMPSIVPASIQVPKNIDAPKTTEPTEPIPQLALVKPVQPEKLPAESHIPVRRMHTTVAHEALLPTANIIAPRKAPVDSPRPTVEPGPTVSRPAIELPASVVEKVAFADNFIGPPQSAVRIPEFLETRVLAAKPDLQTSARITSDFEPPAAIETHLPVDATYEAVVAFATASVAQEPQTEPVAEVLVTHAVIQSVVEPVLTDKLFQQPEAVIDKPVIYEVIIPVINAPLENISNDEPPRLDDMENTTPTTPAVEFVEPAELLIVASIQEPPPNRQFVDHDLPSVFLNHETIAITPTVHTEQAPDTNSEPQLVELQSVPDEQPSNTVAGTSLPFMPVPAVMQQLEVTKNVQPTPEHITPLAIGLEPEIELEPDQESTVKNKAYSDTTDEILAPATPELIVQLTSPAVELIRAVAEPVRLDEACQMLPQTDLPDARKTVCTDDAPEALAIISDDNTVLQAQSDKLKVLSLSQRNHMGTHEYRPNGLPVTFRSFVHVLKDQLSAHAVLGWCALTASFAGPEV